MAELTNWISEHWGISETVQWKIVLSIIVVVSLWLIRYFTMSVVFMKITNAKERYNWNNAVRNIYYTIVLLAIGAIWIDRVHSLATFLGLVTAGLAIALRDPLANLAGWLFILIRKPFEVGDRIEIDGVAGDVIDIRFFQFTINEIGNWVDADQSTGRIIHIPNGKVFTQAQANFTQGFRYIWHEIQVMVTFESNWKVAKELVLEITNKHAEPLTETARKKLVEASKKFLIYYSTLTPTVYVDVKDSGVMLNIRLLVDPKKRRGTEHKIWEDILTHFAEHNDIDFAYPTRRVYYNLQEGKEGTIKPPNFPKQ